MRLTKALASIAALGVLLAATSMTSSSKADEPEPKFTAKCEGKSVVVTVSSPWHINTAAPWKFDKGTFNKGASSEDKAVLDGPCEGTVKAYVCSGHNGQGSCKGPIAVSVK